MLATGLKLVAISGSSDAFFGTGRTTSSFKGAGTRHSLREALTTSKIQEILEGLFLCIPKAQRGRNATIISVTSHYVRVSWPTTPPRKNAVALKGLPGETIVKHTHALSLAQILAFTIDAEECEMFGPEVCRNGHCVNTVPGFTCFCHIGYFYDSSRLECVGEKPLSSSFTYCEKLLSLCGGNDAFMESIRWDEQDLDECENEETCANGKCLNTAGSYHCFCSLPLVLDATRNRCINTSSTADELDERDIHLDICWERVSNYMCNEPLLGQQTTYTECCCRYGEAWSQDCALCPPRSSEDFAQLCNVARSEAGLRERPGYEYEQHQEDHHYGFYGPDLESYYNHLGLAYGASDTSLSNREPRNEFADGAVLQAPPLHPLQEQPHYLPDQTGQYSSFEGLQAEECGILNGCDNGRCVRVQEGYTCDCFDGFQLDLILMACVDVNECEEANASVTLCEGSTCENTEGSYRCNCLPGYVALAEPHRCVPETLENPDAA
ncbi:Latent-transforming growth factor beta-binding protein 2 [Varanus komodoensis]|nr:Latent-transforming growth factor beta-binding protein 2 [Varanus komodoensis]